MADIARPARLSRLRELLAEERHSSQQELSAALADGGVTVSQSTLSKDLVAVGAIRRRTADGSLVYALDAAGDISSLALEKLARLAAELVQSLQSTGNLMVLRTPPGAAQFFAASLDTARLPGVMGTIAGDDTVLLITADQERAEDVTAIISEMTRTGKPPTRMTNREDDK
ncbi:MAG: arginine repressor [Propionibacteriaceae bacterium]|nr:arginine repressor [Propionibacteriaceae bacterium]